MSESMSDASTMDPAAVLQRVDEIEARMGARLLTLSEGEWLCTQLRTALADTRRVDILQRFVDRAGDKGFAFFPNCHDGTRLDCYGRPHVMFYEDMEDRGGKRESIRGALDSQVELSNAAMAATPRES